MRQIFLFFLLPVVLCVADDLPTPKGILPLTLDPVIEIDANNRQMIAQRDALESERIDRIFQERIFPWHLLVGGIMACSALVVGGRQGWLSYVSWKQKREYRDPHIEALETLDKLESRQLPSQGLYDAFYVGLTDILRRFVERTYNIPPGQATSEEYLGDILRNADPIKFGRQPSTGQECSEVLATARELIRKNQEKIRINAKNTKLG